MAETEIKRVNFFDGQFLKQGELNDLSNYAVHMQRRLLFVLFDRSGVLDTGSSDLAVDVPTAGQKAIRVRAGMALGRRLDVAETHEIILRTDVSPINLTTQSATVPAALQANDTGIVTIHYEEKFTGGDAGKPTRINENAVITVHRNALPLDDPTRPLVVLAKVAFNTMAVTDQRQTARINGGLTGGKPVQQPQVVSSINPQQALQGTNIAITINGTKLAGATAIAFSNAGLVVQNVTPDGTGTQITATLSIAANAALGPTGFDVTTPGGSVPSPEAITFTVLPAPQITTVTPTIQSPGNQIFVRGNNIRRSELAVGQTATGTTVAFIDQNTLAVLAQGTDVKIAQDGGTTQQISVTVPPTASWVPAPAPPTSLRVKVQVSINGTSVVSATTVRIDFH
jgi:hypothetical protein